MAAWAASPSRHGRSPGLSLALQQDVPLIPLWCLCLLLDLTVLLGSPCLVEPVSGACDTPPCLPAGWGLGDSVPSVGAWTLPGLPPSLAPSWSSPAHASPFLLTVLNFLLYQYLALCGPPVEEHQKNSCTTASVEEQNQGRSKHQQCSLYKNCIKGQIFL